ncbi:MAG: hypothetical protein ING36_07955 [Burkholderiales bacterium]|jgi:hypothetical protein|nr:hypothetical protein [Burkholderiales bacterium]
MTIIRLLPSLLMIFCATVFAQNNNPLDFGYEVIGPPQFRPSAVFNDGKDTFIQTRSDNDLDTKALTGVERRGIYLVVPGLPERVNFRLAVGESIEIRRLRSVKPNQVPSSEKQESVTHATEKPAPAKLPRIAFIGAKPELKSQVLASGERVPLQLAYSGMKPESYSLVLDVPKDLDRRPTDWDLPSKGMNWTEALELLAEASNTYVEVNAGSKLVRVTATPALSHRKTAEAAGMATPSQQKMRDVASTARLPVITPPINPPVATTLPAATPPATAAVPEKLSQPQQLRASTLAPQPTVPAQSLPIATSAVAVPTAQILPVAGPVPVINEERRLQLEPNAMLHLVLEKFGKDNGTSIQWVHPDRIRISTARQIRGESVRQVLEQTLNLFELTAVYDKATNTYYVR